MVSRHPANGGFSLRYTSQTACDIQQPPPLPGCRLLFVNCRERLFQKSIVGFGCDPRTWEAETGVLPLVWGDLILTPGKPDVTVHICTLSSPEAGQEEQN